MSAVDNVNRKIEWLNAISFRFRPKTAEPLENGLALSKGFEELCDADRLAVIKNVPDSTSTKLLSLSAFMAEKAISTNDPIWIRSALLLHVIEDFRKDYRENIRYLVLIAYAAKRIGVDLTKVVDSLVPLASDRARSRMNEFVSRDEKLNNLQSFGVKEIRVNDEARFVPV